MNDRVADRQTTRQKSEFWLLLGLAAGAWVESNEVVRRV